MNHQRTILMTNRSKATALALVLGGLLSVSVSASQDQPADPGTENAAAGSRSEMVVYSGDNVAPWRLFLGAHPNWNVPVQGPKTRSFKSKIVTVYTADYTAKDDAYQAEWNKGEGQIYWMGEGPVDLTDMLEQDAALSMVIRIDEAPKKSVLLKMDCGYPCAGAVNVGKLFEAVPSDQWFRLSFKLSCFEEAGANMSNIMAPMVVSTKSSFKMSIHDVRIMFDPPAESVVDCS